MTPPINIGGSTVDAITIDGTEVTEVTVDGSTVFSTIADNLVSLYDFEDEGTTSTATDSVGNNDADLLNGAAYNTDAAVGDHSIDYTSNNAQLNSQSAVDYISNGNETAMSLTTWVKPAKSLYNFAFPVQFIQDPSNWFGILDRNDGTWSVQARVAGNTNPRAISSISLDTSTWTHLVGFLTQSEIGLYVDNTLEVSSSHSQDITNIGAGNIIGGDGAAFQGERYDGLADDTGVFNDKVTALDVDTLYNK